MFEFLKYIKHKYILLDREIEKGILVFWVDQIFEISENHYMGESWYSGTIKSLRFPRYIMVPLLFPIENLENLKNLHCLIG